MNCSTCGAGTAGSTSVCGLCHSGPSSSTAGPSRRGVTPLRGRRWLLRRAGGGRKGIEGELSDSGVSFEVEVRRKMDAAVHAAVVARSARRRDELRDEDACEFEDDKEETHVEVEVEEEEEEEAGEEEVVEEEEEGEVDAASMEVGAAHSETASTVSRAAFSVSDKVEVEREGAHVLSAAVRDRGVRRGRDNARAQLRAAYVRELLLSSLGS